MTETLIVDKKNSKGRNWGKTLRENMVSMPTALLSLRDNRSFYTNGGQESGATKPDLLAPDTELLREPKACCNSHQTRRWY